MKISLEESWVCKEVQRVTQRTLEEARVYEYLHYTTKKSLEKSRVCEEIQCVTQRLVEEARKNKEKLWDEKNSI
jgi:hypothetical protein